MGVNGNAPAGVATPTREELALALAGAMDETASKAIKLAGDMREQGEALLRDAARLEREADKLLAGAEAMGIDAGETDREVQEVADHGTTVNSRGEKVTYETCVKAARELGRFDRERFAEVLALKPIIASRWLARLREQKVLGVEEGPEGEVVYDFVRPGGPPAPRPRHETADEMALRLAPDHVETERGTVEGTGRKLGPKLRKRNESIPGRRHPGRKG